jgi:hypothetical protein
MALEMYWQIDDSILEPAICKRQPTITVCLLPFQLAWVSAFLSDHELAVRIASVLLRNVPPERKLATLSYIIQISSVGSYRQDSTATTFAFALPPGLYLAAMHAHLAHAAGPLIPSSDVRMYDAC